MKYELTEQALDAIIGGFLPDPVSGIDYQEILDFEARICGDWVYDEFEKGGAAGLKQKMREEFGDLWFVVKFPVYDGNGNLIG